MFAYKEVPQASTGFSPFELLYGRQIRGPLKDARSKSPESVVSYVLLMQERLHTLRDLVRTNMQGAQQLQKTWYDKNARSRQLKPGDQVLVLLPTSSSKLLAEWQGPYEISQRIGKVNYEVVMPNRRKRQQLFHINMLRQWHSPTATSCWAAEVTDIDEGDGADVVAFLEPDAAGSPKIGEHLSPAQATELKALWQHFASILDENPGRTTMVEHRIPTEHAHPIRLSPYRIPHAYRWDELQSMEQAGIIERSSSECAAPIVLVKKKDNTLRMCVDYRRFNRTPTPCLALTT